MIIGILNLGLNLFWLDNYANIRGRMFLRGNDEICYASINGVDGIINAARTI